MTDPIQQARERQPGDNPDYRRSGPRITQDERHVWIEAANVAQLSKDYIAWGLKPKPPKPKKKTRAVPIRGGKRK